ncbi:MAG: divalent-cation tolerance protein CutA [Patescibacteria group bacterium]
MKEIILAYITCKSIGEAKSIGKVLLDKKLCACTNIFPEMHPMFFWPPHSKTLDEGKEVVLIAKTSDEKYKELEEEVIKVHSYDVPCILGIPVKYVSERYYQWLIGEIDG